MATFLAALGIFLLAHAVPAAPAVRSRLTALLGERFYLLLYSLLSLGLLAWLITAAVRAPFVPLWDARPWHHGLAAALMLPACMLWIGGGATPNPLSLGFRRRGFDPQRPGIVGVTRHPLLWGFLLWAGAHLLANGDVVAAILFGSMALFSALGMLAADRRARRRLGGEWGRLAGGTSALPFGAGTRSATALRWRPRDLAVTVAGGGALYLLLLWLHPRVIGVDPLALLR